MWGGSMSYENELMQYDVEWHTKTGMGATYYHGSLRVWAYTESDAGERARREVHRDFREWPLSHIVIDEIVEA
jgi:hypothetical protein